MNKRINILIAIFTVLIGISCNRDLVKSEDSKSIDKKSLVVFIENFIRCLNTENSIALKKMIIDSSVAVNTFNVCSYGTSSVQNIHLINQSFIQLSQKHICIDTFINRLFTVKKYWDINNTIYDYRINQVTTNCVTYCSIELWINILNGSSLQSIYLPLVMYVNDEWRMIPDVYNERSRFFDPQYESSILSNSKGKIDTLNFSWSKPFYEKYKDSIIQFAVKPYLIRNSYYVFEDLSDSFFIDSNTIYLRSDRSKSK